MRARSYRTREAEVEASASPDEDEPRSFMLFREGLSPLVLPADWFVLLFDAALPQPDADQGEKP